MSNENCSIICNFCQNSDEVFNHNLHSENRQLNSLVDLVINLGHRCKEKDDKIQNICHSFISCQKTFEKKLDRLCQNIDYLHDQIKSISAQLSLQQQRLNFEKFPSKVEIKHLINSIDTLQPKAVEIETRNLVDSVNQQVQKLDLFTKDLSFKLEEIKRITNGI